MVNKHTLTKRIDELETNITQKFDNLEQRYSRFKKDFGIILASKFFVLYSFALFLMSAKTAFGIVTLMLTFIAIVVEYTTTIIMVRKIMKERINIKKNMKR